MPSMRNLTAEKLTPFVLCSCIAVAPLVGGVAEAQERQWGRDRSITQISQSVYRWGSDNQYGAYIATSQGIIVVDGHYCPSGTVQWLKSELERRYDVPVKFVVLSHDHQDHNCNSQIFGDTASVVGHRNIRAHLLREGRVSAVPEITFDRSMELILGGVTVRLLYFGPSHSDNLIQVHIPEEGVLIAVDAAKGKSLYPDFRDMDVHGQLDILRILETLPDVEVVLPGHGPVTDQSAFANARRFILALRDRVLEHMVDGKSLAQIRELVTMSDFHDYSGLETYLDANIVTMYGYLYRYREPNARLTGEEAVRCIEDVTQCRTGG